MGGKHCVKDTTPSAPAEASQAGIISEDLSCLSNWRDLWEESPQVPENAEPGIKHGGKTKVGSQPFHMLPGGREREKETQRGKQRPTLGNISIQI